MTEPSSDHAPAAAVRWTATVIAIATALLLLFNADSPRAWTAQLAPGAGALAARRLADGWWALTRGLGLAAPRAALTRAWNAAAAARFPPPGRGARDGAPPRRAPDEGQARRDQR